MISGGLNTGERDDFLKLVRIFKVATLFVDVLELLSQGDIAPNSKGVGDGTPLTLEAQNGHKRVI
jgi:hypothetical protein